MREKFVITRNVKKFQTAVHRINHKLRGVERMALVTGEVGLGKTEAAIQYGAHNGAIMIRMWEMMSGHWLLREMVKELGVEPAWRTEKIVEQLKKRLSESPRTIILDEIDRFFRDQDPKKLSVLETLRDVHDVCRCPMVFIGEKDVEGKIRPLTRLYDRIVEIVKFERFDTTDVKQVVGELSDFRFENDAIEKITQESDGRIRPIMSLVHAAENTAKINQLKTITAKDF